MGGFSFTFETPVQTLESLRKCMKTPKSLLSRLESAKTVFTGAPPKTSLVAYDAVFFRVSLRRRMGRSYPPLRLLV